MSLICIACWGASDVVVTRAGATTILELAALEKPTILIPNGKLTGGHQLKNAAVYEQAGAVAVLDEDLLVANPTLLAKEIELLFSEPQETAAMAHRFKAFSKPDAAKDMAEMIIRAARS